MENIRNPWQLIKSHIPECLLLAFFAYLLTQPEQATSAARQGLSLWATGLLPSLLPFAFGTLWLQASGALARWGRAMGFVRPLFHLPACVGGACLAAFISGYPIGAHLTVSAYQEKRLNKKQALNMLALTSNASPLFLAGTVGAGFFGSPAVGWILILAHYAGAWIPAMVYGAYTRPKQKSVAPPEKPKPYPAQMPKSALSPLGALSKALRESALLQLPVAVSITLAFVLLSGLPSALGESPLVRGIVEMSSGCHAVAIQNGNLPLRVALAAGVTGFGGLAVLGQSLGAIGDCGIPLSGFVLRKLLHGACSFTLALGLCAVLLKSQPASSLIQMAAPVAYPTPWAALWCALCACIALAHSFYEWKASKTL